MSDNRTAIIVAIIGGICTIAAAVLPLLFTGVLSVKNGNISLVTISDLKDDIESGCLVSSAEWERLKKAREFLNYEFENLYIEVSDWEQHRTDQLSGKGPIEPETALRHLLQTINKIKVADHTKYTAYKGELLNLNIECFQVSSN